MVMPHTDWRGAIVFAERVRVKVQESLDAHAQRRRRRGHRRRRSASLLARADTALYSAKAAGRNRIFLPQPAGDRCRCWSPRKPIRDARRRSNARGSTLTAPGRCHWPRAVQRLRAVGGLTLLRRCVAFQTVCAATALRGAGTIQFVQVFQQNPPHFQHAARMAVQVQ